MFRRHLKKIIYTLVFLIPLIIFFFRPKNNKALIDLDSSGFVSGVFSTPLREIKKIWLYRETFDEYVALKNRNDVLRAKLVGLQSAIDETYQRSVLDRFKANQQFPSVTAEVIGRDPTNWNAALIIDRGKKDGLKVGMAVMTHLGMVGRVAEVGATTAKVIMLADPHFAVAAIVQRTRESGLLTGTLQGLCRLQYLTDQADVKEGDLVVTSGMSTAFPEGVLIGEVIDVKASALSHGVDCLVRPAVNLSQIEKVLIIKR